MGKGNKVAKFGAMAAPAKRPVVTQHEKGGEHPLAWRFSHADKGGPFARDVQPLEKFHEVMHKLVESMA